MILFIYFTLKRHIFKTSYYLTSIDIECYLPINHFIRIICKRTIKMENSLISAFTLSIVVVPKNECRYYLREIYTLTVVDCRYSVYRCKTCVTRIEY